MVEPLISVILPTYNRPSLTWRALESLCYQTYPHMEIIIIDDGSSPSIISFLEPFQKKFPLRHIRFFLSPHRGVSSARNIGISFAKGDFIAFFRLR